MNKNDLHNILDILTIVLIIIDRSALIIDKIKSWFGKGE